MRDWVKKVTLRQIDLAGMGACLAAGAIFAILCVMPLVDRSDAFARTQAQLDRRRQQSQEATRDVAIMKNRLAGIRKQLADHPFQIQTNYHLNQRLAQLTEAASQAGMSIDQVQPQAPVNHPRFETVPIRLIGSGSYPVCTQFLHGLLNRFPDTSIESFQVSGDPAKPQSPATIQVNLLWYAAVKPRTE